MNKMRVLLMVEMRAVVANNKVSTSLIVGVVVSIVAVIAIVSFLIWFLKAKWKKATLLKIMQNACQILGYNMEKKESYNENDFTNHKQIYNKWWFVFNVQLCI